MGSEAVLSPLREVQVYRDGTLVASGGTYIPGEELLVSLVGPDDTGVQFVFEATNAVFIGGGCDGHRVANSKAAKLLLPSDTSSDAPSVQIIAGWATGYTTVQITSTFVLNPALVIPVEDSVKSNEKEDTKTKIVPEEPPQAPIGVVSKIEELGRSGSEEDPPTKTHLRKQPKELDLPQTLPADHKIKMKPKSPSAFSRTHPVMMAKNSKLPAETKNENGSTGHQAGEKASLAASELRSKSAPLSTEPTGAVPKNPILPSKHTVETEEDAKIENVMESMDKFAEQVQQHRTQLKAANALKAPLKNPSKRNKFMDSWHTKTRKEKMTIKLAVGDIKTVGDEEQASEAGEAQDNNPQKDAEVHTENLPGAGLSATEKRLRRSRGGLPLEMKFKAHVEEFPDEQVKPRSGIHQFTSSPGQLILLVLAAGTTFFAGAVLLLSVMLCLMGRKDDVWRVVNRLLRRKQGQDKE
eukprot:gene13038-15037_t